MRLAARRPAIAGSIGFLFGLFLLLVVTLPLEAAFVLEVGFTVRQSHLVLAILAATALCLRVRGLVAAGLQSPLSVPIGLFIAAAAFSLVMNVVAPPPRVEFASEVGLRGSAFRGFFQLGLLGFSTLPYFLALHLCRDAARLLTVVRVHVWTAVVVAGYGVYQFVANGLGWPFVDVTNALSTGGGSYGAAKYGAWYYFRSHGTFQEPLNFGHYLLSALPLTAALALYRPRGRARLLGHYAVLILLQAGALFLTRSRGAWIGCAAGLVLLFSAVKRPARRRALEAVAVVGATLAALAVAIWPAGALAMWLSVLDRFSPNQPVAEPRIEAFLYTVGLFLDYPILGVGLGNYAFHRAGALYADLPGTAYGVFWQILAETGIVGFAAFAFMLASLYRLLWRALRLGEGGPWHPYLLGLLASLTALFVQHLSFGDRLGLYVWFLMGVAAATARLVERDPLARR